PRPAANQATVPATRAHASPLCLPRRCSRPVRTPGPVAAHGDAQAHRLTADRVASRRRPLAARARRTSVITAYGVKGASVGLCKVTKLSITPIATAAIRAPV